MTGSTEPDAPSPGVGPGSEFPAEPLIAPVLDAETWMRDAQLAEGEADDAVSKEPLGWSGEFAFHPLEIEWKPGP